MMMLHILTMLTLCLFFPDGVMAAIEIWGDPEVLTHIKIDCFNTSATVTYIGDPIVVLGFGVGKACVFEEDPENARYILNAVFEATNEDDCVMMKRPHERFYQIKLQARYTAEDLEAEEDETVMLSCNFEPTQKSQAQTIRLREPFSEPMIILDDMGLEARSGFNLTIRHLDGSLVHDGILVGTEVELIATMRPVPGEVAFRALLCYADMPGEEASIPIIVDGCGTGTPFPENKGFVRFGNLARSPTLKLFRAVKTRPVGFRCEFVVCKDQCDRYSCPKEEVERAASYRITRSVHEKSARKWVKSRNIDVYLHGEKKKATSNAVYLIMAEEEPEKNSTDGGNETWSVQSKQARFYVDESSHSESSQRSIMAPKFLILTSLGAVLGLLSIVVGIWLACRFKKSSTTFQPPPSPGNRNLTIGPPIPISANYSEQFEELSL